VAFQTVAQQPKQTALSTYSEIGLPYTEVFDSVKHQGTAINWGLAQNHNGLVYCGNGRGLSEWDGERWTLYPTPNKTVIFSVSPWVDERLYVGTTNDIGYYAADEKGQLVYFSLIADWPAEQRQFGAVLSTAANAHGVMFVTQQFLLFWDGHTVQTLVQAPQPQQKVFALGNSFIYQAKHSDVLYRISDQLEVQKTEWSLPQGANVQAIFLNQQQQLIVITAQAGIFIQHGTVLQQIIAAKELGDSVELSNGIQASDGYYYVTSSNAGLFIFDENLQLLRHYSKEDNLGSDTFYGLMEDQQGSIWLAGILKIVRLSPPHVYSLFRVEGESRLSNRMALLQDKVTIAGEGIYQFSPSLSPFQTRSFKQLLPDQRQYWDFVEYQGHVVYAGMGGIYTQEIAEDGAPKPLHQLITADRGRSLWVDKDKNQLYAGTSEGLFHIQRHQHQWQYSKVPGINADIIGLAMDTQGGVWAGTPAQLLYYLSPPRLVDTSPSIRQFSAADGLGANNVMPFRLSSGVVIGTNDGVMTFASDRQPPLQFAKGYPSVFTTPQQDVFRLYEDQQGRIWYRIGQHTGFAQQNVAGEWQAHEGLFQRFVKNSYKGFVSTAPNTLWFVMTEGLIYRINLQRMQSPPPQGKLAIRQVINLDTEETISGGLGQNTLPELDQQHNSMRFYFALAEFANHNPSLYRHRLIGSDYQQWSPWSSESYKDFTLLRGADYRFELEAKDGWGRVVSAATRFTVKPPWYLSNAAISIYLACSILLLLLSAWLGQKWRNQKLLQQKRVLELEVASRTQDVLAKSQELQQQHAVKERFFTNVSHEFRTPLTLTIEPLKSLLTDHEQHLPEEGKALASTALNNAKIMLVLIGQVLDMNRLEAGKLPLHVNQYDIAALLRNLQQRFSVWAAQQGQVIDCENCENPLLVYMDLDQIDKCVANLLTNAIKYSGRDSRITLALHANNGDVVVTVSDNGVGIGLAEQPHVFERFYQGKAAEHAAQPGTGIGLALVKELVALHHGNVDLHSKRGEGCTFTLHLKKGKAHFTAEQLSESSGADISGRLTSLPAPPSSLLPLPLNQQTNDDITTLLIVDDNAELRHFMSIKLANTYRIIEAENGDLGFVAACEYLPDLIISDVMMPGISGLALCKKVKANPATQSIPVILLTAKASKREVVEGFSAGADDYLTKPFDTSELVMRVNALLNGRKQIRQDMAFEQSSKVLHIDKVSTFTQQFSQLVVKHLNKPHLSVEYLADLLHMTSKTLTRKCNKELGVPPLAFITQIRMHHACNLLSEGKLSISDIAYALGFESLAYFSKNFKKHTGKSPTEFSQSVHQG